MTTLSARTALVAHRLGAPAATGIGRYVSRLAGAIAAVDDPHRFVLVAAREAEPVRWQPPGIDVVRLPGPRRALLAAWALAGHPSLDRLTGRPALVHVLSPFTPVPTSAPLVVTIHDLMPLTFPAWYPRLERWAFGRALERFTRDGAHVITPSETVARDVVATLGVPRDRITVVPQGVSDGFRDDFPAARRDEVCRRFGVVPDRFVIVVGSVSTRKNSTAIVRAAAALGRRGSPPSVLLAGPDGPGAGAIRGEIDRLGLRSTVRLAGYVDDADLAVLLASARALAHPSRYEGFGMTPLEAMASGLPAVVARAGALPEVVGDAALLVDPDDVDGWADALAALTEDAALRGRLTARGRALVSSFTWERTARETLAVHRLVAGPRGQA